MAVKVSHSCRVLQGLEDVEVAQGSAIAFQMQLEHL